MVQSYQLENAIAAQQIDRLYIHVMAKTKKRASRPVAGIDLGGTNMQIGVVNAEKKIIGREGRKTEGEGGFAHVVKRLAKGVRRACEEAGIEVKDLAAV